MPDDPHEKKTMVLAFGKGEIAKEYYDSKPTLALRSTPFNAAWWKSRLASTLRRMGFNKEKW